MQCTYKMFCSYCTSRVSCFTKQKNDKFRNLVAGIFRASTTRVQLIQCGSRTWLSFYFYSLKLCHLSSDYLYNTVKGNQILQVPSFLFCRNFYGSAARGIRAFSRQ